MSIKGRVLRTMTVGAASAAAMYFLDPERGRGRRIRTRDQLAAGLRRAERRTERRLRYMEGKAEGVLHAVDGVPSKPPADDQTLADRIRSELGHRFPRASVEINVVDGVAELRGELDSRVAIDELVEAVRRVPHVVAVTNLLHVPGEPAPNKEEALEASREAAGSVEAGGGTGGGESVQ